MTPDAQAYRPWPSDQQGRLLPSIPHAMSVHFGRLHHTPTGQKCRVSYASRQKFVVLDNAHPDGVTWRAEKWGEFLDSLVSSNHYLLVHSPGCDTGMCSGCDLSHVGREAAAPAAARPTRHLGAVTGSPRPTTKQTAPTPLSAIATRARISRMTAAGTSVSQRTQRILVNAVEVLNECEISEVERGRYIVSEGHRRHELEICDEWSHDPRCTCVEGRRAELQGFCRHTVALLLREVHLRCQLLGFFL